MTIRASAKIRTKEHRASRLVRWVLFAIVGAVFLSLVPIYSSSRHTCLHCRVDKLGRRYLGIPWNTEMQTELTPWYLTRNLKHEHTWASSGCTTMWTATGGVIWSCRRQHPIHVLPPAMHLVLAQRAPDELEALYRVLERSDTEQGNDAALAAYTRAVELL